MTKKEQAAFEIIDRVCADFRGNRKEHVTIQASLQIIHTALNPKVDEKKTDEKKIKVPRKTLPRDRKRKNKDKGKK